MGQMQNESEHSIKRVWKKPVKGPEKGIYLITTNIFPFSVFFLVVRLFDLSQNKKKTKEAFKSHITHI